MVGGKFLKTIHDMKFLKLPPDGIPVTCKQIIS